MGVLGGDWQAGRGGGGKEKGKASVGVVRTWLAFRRSCLCGITWSSYSSGQKNSQKLKLGLGSM